MNSKTIVIIVVLVFAVSISVTVTIMNAMYSEANQLLKEQTEFKQRLQEWSERLNDQCDRGDDGIQYKGYFWCSDYNYSQQMRDDCAYANKANYVAWCEYQGLR